MTDKSKGKHRKTGVKCSDQKCGHFKITGPNLGSHCDELGCSNNIARCDLHVNSR
jgi:hypothetical protein